jgi:hypothetical protein
MSSRLMFMFVMICFLAGATSANAQIPGLGTTNNPSPELVGQLTKKLNITPQQAIGGAGSIFGVAQTKLKAEDFLKVSNAVPGMDGLLKAAPKVSGGSNAMSQMGSMLPGKAGALAQTAGAFKQLGLKPEMAAKFLPVMGEFLNLKGGANVAGLFGGVFK